MNQVVAKLNAKANKITGNDQTDNYELNLQLSNRLNLNDYNTSSSIDNSLHGKLSQVIQNFDQMNSKEIIESLMTTERRMDKSAKNFSIIIDEIVELIFKERNKGINIKVINRHIFDYLNNQSINLQEIINWLLNNRNNSNSFFLLGYFNYYGIEMSKNGKNAFELFINASKRQNHILAQYYIGECYQNGYGVTKDERLAFKYYEKVANKDFTRGQLSVGYLYENGIGIEKDFKMAFYWYEKSAKQGNQVAQFNLAQIYENGNGIDKSIDKAIYWYKKSAEYGYKLAEDKLMKWKEKKIGKFNLFINLYIQISYY